MPIDNVPQLMKQAILAAEDERFYQHGGVDYIGIMRAALSNVLSNQMKPRAQVQSHNKLQKTSSSATKERSRASFTKHCWLSRSSTICARTKSLSCTSTRYISVNAHTDLQRRHRFITASHWKKLSIAEMAMLAGLPKAPSSYNPVANPRRAALRQQYVLRACTNLDSSTNSNSLQR